MNRILVAVAALSALALCGCASHLSEVEYYPDGQIKRMVWGRPISGSFSIIRWNCDNNNQRLDGLVGADRSSISQ